MTNYHSSYNEILSPGGDPHHCRGLEISSLVPVHRLATEPQPSIDVSRWEYDGYEVHNSLCSHDAGPPFDGVSIKIGSLLDIHWLGVPPFAQYRHQYFPFSALPDRPREFLALFKLNESEQRLDYLKFSEAGNEVTVVRYYRSCPERHETIQFRRDGAALVL